MNLRHKSTPAASAWRVIDSGNPGSPTPFATTDTKTDWMVGGSYDAGFAKGFLTCGRAKSDRLVPEAKTVSLGASIPVGFGKVLVGGARTCVTPGHNYNLSKRTDVYAMLEHDKITTFVSGASYGFGVRHCF